jgi:hypothetical protein
VTQIISPSARTTSSAPAVVALLLVAPLVLAILAASLDFYSGGGASDNYMGNTGGKAFGQAATSVLQKSVPAAAATGVSVLQCIRLMCTRTTTLFTRQEPA